MRVDGVPLHPTGYHCPTPVVFDYQGDVFQRPCGLCPRCLAARKRDLTGRAGAEAVVSDDIIVWTLTYADGEPGAVRWQVADRQKFVDRLRKWFKAEAHRHLGLTARYRQVGDVGKLSADVIAKRKAAVSAITRRVRYTGVGETGSRGTHRHHWHIVTFLKGGPTNGSGILPVPIPSSDRDARGRLIRENRVDAGVRGSITAQLNGRGIWPHGFITVDVLPRNDGSSRRDNAIRYCSKYLSKAVAASRRLTDRRLGRSEYTDRDVYHVDGAPMLGPSSVERDTVLFRSLKPALGAEYLADWGRQHADKGLALPKLYRVPGVRFSRGTRELVGHKPHGVSRQTIADAYKARWRAVHGCEAPACEGLRHLDVDYAEDRRASRNFPKWDGRSRRIAPVPRQVPDNLQGLLMVYQDGRLFGTLQTLRNGVALWQGYVGGSLGEFAPEAWGGVGDSAPRPPDPLRIVDDLDNVPVEDIGPLRLWLDRQRKGPIWWAYESAVREQAPLLALWVKYDAAVQRAETRADLKYQKLMKAYDKAKARAVMAGIPPVVPPERPAPKLPKPPRVRRPEPVPVPDFVPWVSPRERFEAMESDRCERLVQLMRALPRGEKTKEGLASREALTGFRRRMVMLSRVHPDGSPVRREYRPPRDPSALLERDLFQRREPVKAELVVLRPSGNEDYHWPGRPRFQRKTP